MFQSNNMIIFEIHVVRNVWLYINFVYWGLDIMLYVMSSLVKHTSGFWGVVSWVTPGSFWYNSNVHTYSVFGDGN